MKPPKIECDGHIMVDHGFGQGDFSRCTNTAKTEFDGKRYCLVHDPVRVKARRTRWREKFDAENARRDEHYRRLDAIAKNGETARKALDAIARGELNDPVSYAALVIERYERE